MKTKKTRPLARPGSCKRSRKDKVRITHMTEKNKRTQCDRIVDYLATHGPASCLDLTVALNITSASKRISELRKLGMIGQFKCSGYNRDGYPVHYNRYYVRKEYLNV